MKKKVLAVCMIFSISLCMASCGERQVVAVNVENPESVNSPIFGTDALVEIGDCLYYDQTTYIVYWWNGYIHYSYCATTPSPYYAPNGYPYKYNPETNTLEEMFRKE